MREIFRSPWFGRGLRLAVVVGLLAAGWHAWGVWDRFGDDRQTSIQRELTYECAARLPEDALKQHVNEFGNINVKTLCFTEDDFFVAPFELEMVRNGTLKFETPGKPFDWAGTVIVGLLWAVSTVLFTIAVLSVVSMVRWVWGEPR
ncbi:hypothetical protein [Phyllobacterium sp. P5_D12]